jgi:hypothetical protein
MLRQTIQCQARKKKKKKKKKKSLNRKKKGRYLSRSFWSFLISFFNSINDRMKKQDNLASKSDAPSNLSFWPCSCTASSNSSNTSMPSAIFFIHFSISDCVFRFAVKLIFFSFVFFLSSRLQSHSLKRMSTDDLRIRVTSSGKVRNYVAFAQRTLESQTASTTTTPLVVVLVGVQSTISKAVTVVEILKRVCNASFTQTTAISKTEVRKQQSGWYNFLIVFIYLLL